MKFLWGLIGLLAVGTAVMFLRPTPDATGADASTPEVQATSAEASELSISDAITAVDRDTPDTMPIAGIDVELKDASSQARDEVSREAEQADAVDTKPAQDNAEEAVALQETTTELAEVLDSGRETVEDLVSDVSNADESAEPLKVPVISPGAVAWLKETFGGGQDAAVDAQETSDAITSTDAELAAPSAEPPAPKVAIDHVAELEDGSLLIGGRWPITGKGTTSEPYVMDWRVLQSAGRVYNPRLGRDDLPAWAERLDGAAVKITGYAMLPVGATAAKELLVMLNQWDGCCIGVPPTPFDAAEVTLKNALPPTGAGLGHQGATAYGDVVGTLKIDPYIVRSYLLGLYVIEDASFDTLGG